MRHFVEGFGKVKQDCVNLGIVVHSSHTVDGMDTFRGLGKIATTKPATKNNQRVLRVSAEDISANLPWLGQDCHT